jgi:polysaccharide chain length determinant protein (PEP-CTERM system associated)
MNQQSVSVQRRIPDIEDYIDILRRHKSWIMGPLLAGLVLGVVTAFLWPDTYMSTAVVRVVPPQVPERFVPTNVNSQISERLNAMATSILSRSTLTNIIQTYNLYPDARRTSPTEDIIEDMKADINIGNVTPLGSSPANRRNAVAFQISYKYRNRFIAQKVTEDLVTRFIDENIRSRSSQATQTTDFLQDKMEQAKRELDAIDKKITEFRMRNIGQTPDQKSLNIQQLNTIEFRMATLNAAVSRVSQDKMLLEGELRSLGDKAKALSAIPTQSQVTAASKSDRLMTADREIAQIETNLAALRERYKDAHPDIRRLQANLGVLRNSRDALAREEQAMAEKNVGKPGEPPKISPERARELIDIQAQMAKVQGQIQGKEFELDSLAKEMAALKSTTRQYQSRIESSPVGEQQYIQLMLDREASSKRYEDLKSKMNSSEIATDLENRRQGEILELLDRASLPQVPSQPNRSVIIVAGIVAGLAIGFVLTAAREVKDTSLKNLKDVRAYTQLTILGSVPLLENDLVIRRRRRLTWLAWSVASLVATVTMAGSVYYYHFIAKV